ncbi:2Fe-2S iron-sulfur cluster-binding protein [Hoeflea alexandrii]|uniref:2Fe-2S iron-sulfur cluster-binding protein n=1 Tax=Hoeflea alexandrii TaxID=288436 RepID=UPI0022B03FB2|nr:2Fe-2S iron-sulfur cluster-binding protein [Hoeflea alexandrii]MCZ4288170.1 2Fe-2S iron-sulfur cluster-binding protein [Hoeflea alexandrii]
MPKIIFVSPEGGRTTVEASDGDSVMQTALANGVDGIVAECGGAMMCATCHVYVDDDWTSAVGEASDDERGMLDFAASEVRPMSRLSCQITVTGDLDGLTVHLPDAQI